MPQFTPPFSVEQEPREAGQGRGRMEKGVTMFCFSLCQPSGYEPKLLRAQFDMGTSIFGCDAYAVYSNKAFEVAPGVVTSVVPNNLKCPVHEIAWNVDIFLAVWRKVISQLWYRSYDWTIKTDPDAVMFPGKLVVVLRDHRENVDYINNCQYGLHGPIEVLHRRAVDALAADYQLSPNKDRPFKCVQKYPQSIVGKAQWGEDMFVDICLRTVLGLRVALDTRLMCEAHCDCPDWYFCGNGTLRVTLHPFKRPDMYRQCVANAMAMELITAGPAPAGNELAR